MTAAPLDQPLRFQRFALEKVWGGRALERTPGIPLPAGAKVGETWELVDRAERNSVAAVGAHAGRTLGELVRAHERALLGRSPTGPGGRFPLLVKYIDATEALSVQVHPDAETAARLGNGAEGKTEAWYVLAAAPGAVIYAGTRPDVTRAELERRARGPELLEALCAWPVSAGDSLLVPGGTVHAVGAGVTLLEIQENSDTTYRIWDWGRVGSDGRPRETQLALALASARFGQPERAPSRAVHERSAQGCARAPLARSRSFGTNLLELDGPTRLVGGGQYHVHAVVRGSGRLRVRDSREEHALEPGDVWLLPAACDYCYVEPAAGGLTLVEALYRP